MMWHDIRHELISKDVNWHDIIGHDLKCYYWWKESGYRVDSRLFSNVLFTSRWRMLQEKHKNNQPFFQEQCRPPGWLSLWSLERVWSLGMVGCWVQRFLKSKETRSWNLTLWFMVKFDPSACNIFILTKWPGFMIYVALLQNLMAVFPWLVSMFVHEVANFRDAAGPVWKPSWDNFLRGFSCCADALSCCEPTWGTGPDVSLPMWGMEAGNGKMGGAFFTCIVKHLLHGLDVSGREVSWSRASFSAQAELWCLVFLGVRLWLSPCNCCESQGWGNWIYDMYMYMFVYIYVYMNIHNPCAPDSLRNL